MPGIDSLSMKARLVYGKEKEDLVRKCLNETVSGFRLSPASFDEDCKEKTDCWQESADGRMLRCAIKARATKNDILAVIHEPFYGSVHPDTRWGRDMLQEYFLYITLSKDEETIRVASGKRCHQIYHEIYREWISRVGDMDPARQNFPKLLLDSGIHPGCQLWLHRDRSNGRPKILGFIPPSYLKDGKEIMYYPFRR